jgi:hypothetical protein
MHISVKIAIILLLFLWLSCGHPSREPVVTLVSGLWDLKRDGLKSVYSRGFDFYLGYLSQLLPTETNLIMFGDSEMKKFVSEHRNRSNTLFVERDMEYFNKKWYGKRIL